MSGLDADISVRRGEFRLDATIAIPPGRVLAVIGPNGAGKSSLLLALAGAIPLDAGAVSIDARTLDAAPERRGVGVVFQDPLLFPHLSVLDNVAFGPREQGLSRVDARERAGLWLVRVGIAALAHRRPGELSGGEAQRVSLARALAAEPRLLLLDEPLAALDVAVHAEVRAELAEHVAGLSAPVLLVTHSRDDAAALAHSIVVIEGGRIVQRGTLAELTATPASAFVRRFTEG